jgi:integrase
MTRVRVKGFQIFQDRHGTWRCYHRGTRTAIDLTAAPLGSAEFFAECARIAGLAKMAGPPKPGTLGLLISEYRGHTAFTDDIAARTRSDYQRVFDYLKPIADIPLARFDPPLVVRIRDKAATKHGRRFGNYVKQVLSLTFAWGVERGYLARNPAEKIKGLRRQKGAPGANRPWNDYEREAVFTALPAHMRVPIALMMFCGLDPQDALSLPRSAVKDGRIDARRGKTDEPIWIPLPAPVKAILDAAPAHTAITVAASSRGQVWTGSGFRASWRPIRARLEAARKVAPGLTLKGLRHTVATILAEMGCDDRTIADMLGQKTLAMAQHYSRRADRSRKMTSVVANFDAEVNRRSIETSLSLLKLSQPAGDGN